MPPTGSLNRHTVTAVIVAHDGAALLPGLAQALQSQTHSVERVVGVDTGSHDGSGAVLAELIGQDAVFGMDRDTGYGEAVAVALHHSAARRPAQADPGVRRVEWIWLLHDDCEPAPETLERLLRAASRDRSVVILGPKVLDGTDRRVLREAGISIDRAGRRVTGIEPGEIDQGQHDGNSAVLAVGSAGMLVRRDAWDRLGGFDERLTLFRDDLDFCWRAHAAGYRVQVVTSAVLYHSELSARRRRTPDGSDERRIDRRNGLYVLAVNLPLLQMLWVMAGCAVGSLLRAAWFLLTKQVDRAGDQVFALADVFGHPVRLAQARRSRAIGRRAGYAAVRAFITPARTLPRLAEGTADLLSSGPTPASGGRHQAVSGPGDEEDEQFVEAPSVLRRILGNPGAQLFAVLLVIALVAERRLLGTGPLGGGALVPAWGGAAGLWSEYLAGFHAVGIGSTASAPPYLAIVAALATILGGSTRLAVDVVLLGCVPLAGVTGYVASRRLVTAISARLLLAASYALLPVAFGAVAAGRIGTAFTFITAPLIAVSAGRMLTAPPRPARRAAWATGLLVALTAAFTPLIWLLATVFAVGAAAGRRWVLPLRLADAAIVVLTPFAVLFPWSLHVLASPSAFLTEAGVQPPGLTASALPPAHLMLLSPGGPGLPPYWVTGGLALAVLAALLRHWRRTSPGVSHAGDASGHAVAAGWAVATVGYLAAVVASRVTVSPAGGGPAASGWPGAALVVAAVGVLLAVAPAAQWLARSPRRLAAGLSLAAVATAPALAAAYWVADGVRGPVASISQPMLPAFVSAASTAGTQYRTLILRPAGTGLYFSVMRQGDPNLGAPELAAYRPAQQSLSRTVAMLGAAHGADAMDPGRELAEYGIRWVMLPRPVDEQLAQRLDAASGLTPVSSGPAYDLWQVTGMVARVRVIGPGGVVTPVASQQVGVHGASVPRSGGALVLAEAYGGWTARVNGTALKPMATPVDGWAQGFVLPPGGGKLTITRDDTARALSLVAELIAFLAVCVLALPGKRGAPLEEAEARAATRGATRAAQHGSRAFRGGKARVAVSAPSEAPAAVPVMAEASEDAEASVAFEMSEGSAPPGESLPPEESRPPEDSRPPEESWASPLTWAGPATPEADLGLPAAPRAVPTFTGAHADEPGFLPSDTEAAGQLDAREREPAPPWAAAEMPPHVQPRQPGPGGGQPAGRPERPERSERHARRGGKHGKPGRMRRIAGDRRGHGRDRES